MFIKLSHLLNAALPMLVTLPGINTLFRLAQYSNALLPMLVMLSGIVTLTKFLQL